MVIDYGKGIFAEFWNGIGLEKKHIFIGKVHADCRRRQWLGLKIWDLVLEELENSYWEFPAHKRKQCGWTASRLLEAMLFAGSSVRMCWFF